MAVLSKSNKDKVIEILLEEYKDAKCALDYGNKFQLLVAVVLSAQTTDVAVNKVTPALFKKAPDAKRMGKLSEEEIGSYIRAIGLYRAKAKNVLALAKKLTEDFEGEVPRDFDSLISLPGVGRKTANVVLAEVFGKQTIAVDTHVFRLANRIGLVNEDDVLKTELALQKAIPEKYWTKCHLALIWHGRGVCTARKPNCEDCCLNGICKRNMVKL